MPSVRKGQKEVRSVLDENGEVYTTLREWGKRRGLTPSKATQCILADWSDAMNGRVNPFAIAIAAAAAGATTAPITLSSIQADAPSAEPELSDEERARKAAALEAAEQFF